MDPKVSPTDWPVGKTRLTVAADFQIDEKWLKEKKEEFLFLMM